MGIIINSPVGVLPKDLKDLIKKVGLRVLKRQKIKDIVGITIVNDRMIRKLNKKFRHKDSATDVLAFEMKENGVLGDIYISKETALRNAKRFGVMLKEEILRLVVHGILHLLSYDHKKAAERVLMEKLERDYIYDR